MAFSPTVIPTHTTVSGAIETPGDLIIEGRVEGDICVGGAVEVAEGATCVANVEARTLQVSGELLGNAVCADAIAVHGGGRVVGDLRAPSVEVAAGANVDGRVDLLPPEPRGATIQRLPLATRTPVRRPTMPPVPAAFASAASPAPSSINEPPSDFADEQTTQSARGPGLRSASRTQRPIGRVVPKPPRPSGRVKVEPRNR